MTKVGSQSRGISCTSDLANELLCSERQSISRITGKKVYTFCLLMGVRR